MKRLPLSDQEPRWPAIIAVLGVGGLYAAIPKSLAAGPPWLLPAIVLVLLTLAIVTHRTGHENANRVTGVLLASVMTVFLVWSLAILVLALPKHTESPGTLLRSALALWITNVLVFALWYWRLDAGGPHIRDIRRANNSLHREGAFLFPQMTMDPHLLKECGQRHWSPQFVDYLFLAFNTSTALSPADTATLSRWAKLLQMLQSGLSLTIIALLAARAVNIL
ncbi:MAG: hypothetical protein QM758_12620 [Armatimonas sp.]